MALSAPSVCVQVTQSWGGAGDKLEGRDGIQRDSDRGVGPWDPHKVQQGQVQGPAPGLGQLSHLSQYRLRDELTESSFVEKDFGGAGG